MPKKIAVIGDIILDAYYYCKNRENPESSAPCYTIERKEYRPGGAGNVASNLVKLGSECKLISVAGDDENLKKLEKILKEMEVETVLIKDKRRQTIIKERYLSTTDGRYHFRADFEKKEYIQKKHAERMVKEIKDCEIILISDYDKGTISKKLIYQIKKTGAIIIADTKPIHRKFFKKTFLIKPNVKEVREMTGINDEIKASQKLQKELQTNILLTRGKEGISYFGMNHERYDFPSVIEKEKVFDVTGAGDSVIATFCHFLNKGYSIEECVKLSNKAGAISVQYPGCYQVSEKELFDRD